MKTLLILRHAKSSWKDLEAPDHERPLTKRGKRDAPRVGRFLRQRGLTPDLIVSSTAKRAKKTAKAVAKACGYEGQIEFAPAFYNAVPQVYIAVLRELSDDNQRVMVVGHNPAMEGLVLRLTGKLEAMPTAAFAHVSLPIHQWRDLDDDTKGELIRLWRPRELAQKNKLYRELLLSNDEEQSP